MSFDPNDPRKAVCVIHGHRRLLKRKEEQGVIDILDDGEDERGRYFLVRFKRLEDAEYAAQRAKGEISNG